MQYDFDEIIDRQHTNALNTDGFRSYIFHAGPEKKFPFTDEAFIRMWVADMEFAAAPEIREAIKRRVDRKIFGYTAVFDDDYYQAFSHWCNTRYGWTFLKNEMVFSAGVVPALYELVADLVRDDEKVMITTPAYGHFKYAAEYSRKMEIYSPLKIEKNHFHIDFEDFEKKAADPKMKLLIWCNPHNPSGRIWSETELKRVAAIVEKHGLWIISDEIHCDLLRQGHTHIPMGKIMPDYHKLITCMSASKTFNLSGLMLSTIIIRDTALRKLFKARDKNNGSVNSLSLAAHQAAYTEGAPWLEQLKAYLDGNFLYLQNMLQKQLPACGFKIPESTYLAWIDMRPYLKNIEDIPAFFAEQAGVLLEGGNPLFVGNADGFIRLNLAMPRSVLAEGVRRIIAAVHTHACIGLPG